MNSVRQLQKGWGYRPDPVADALCRACLADNNASVVSWFERALALTPLDDLDYGAARLLPYLARRLEAASWDGNEMPRMRGIHRRAWFDNNIRFDRVRPVLAALVDENIRPVLLKGAALVARVYPDVGTRPMDDVDVLVHPDYAYRAIGIIEKHGYVALGKLAFGPNELASYAGMNFLRVSDGAHLDLHWRPSYEERADAAMDVWNDIKPVLWQGLPLWTLGATDMLLHTFVHAARWNPTSPVRWIVDADLLLRRDPSSIDWSRLHESSVRRRVVAPVLACLREFERFSDAVPHERISNLGAVAIGPFDRLAQKVRISELGRVTGALRLFFIDYPIRTSGVPLQKRVAEYPNYLLHTLDAPNWSTWLKHGWRVARGGPAEKAKLTSPVKATSS